MRREEIERFRRGRRFATVPVAMICCAAAVASAQGSALAPGASSVSAQKKELPVIGRVEKVWIGDVNVVLRAKVDTGARTTSLGVDHTETFKRGNDTWIRFSFRSEAGVPLTLERKVVEFKPLKNKNAPGNEIRPVVLLRLCVANIYRVTRVNLFDRRNFNYPILIGRRFLFGKALVNIAKQYTSEPRCAEMNAG